MKIFSKEFLEKEYGGEKNKEWAKVTSQPMDSQEKEYDAGLKLLLVVLTGSLIFSILGLVFNGGTTLSQVSGLLKEAGKRLWSLDWFAGYYSWHPALTQIVLMIIELSLAALVLAKSKAGKVIYIVVNVLAVLCELGIVFGWFALKSGFLSERYLAKIGEDLAAILQGLGLGTISGLPTLTDGFASLWVLAVPLAQIGFHVTALILLLKNKKVKLYLNYRVL